MEIGEKIKIVPKGWGYEKWIVNNDLYCGKQLFIAQGHKISWHVHRLKAETFWILRGKVLLNYGYDEDINNSNVKILDVGARFDVPIGLIHRLTAIQDSEIIEFSTHHEDSDSYRIIKGD